MTQSKNKVYEIRWHGRGGQGAVTGAMILAEAAYLDGYKGVTAAPFFGAERRGAPIIATNRISRDEIKTYSLVEKPDIVVVLDETLLDVIDVTNGMKENGIVIINSTREPGDIGISAFTVATTDASHYAEEAGLVVSGATIVNTCILGAISRATGLVSLESIEQAIRNHFSGSAAEKNIKGTQLTYEATKLSGEWKL